MEILWLVASSGHFGNLNFVVLDCWFIFKPLASWEFEFPKTQNLAHLSPKKTI